MRSYYGRSIDDGIMDCLKSNPGKTIDLKFLTNWLKRGSNYSFYYVKQAFSRFTLKGCHCPNRRILLKDGFIYFWRWHAEFTPVPNWLEFAEKEVLKLWEELNQDLKNDNWKHDDGWVASSRCQFHWKLEDLSANYKDVGISIKHNKKDLPPIVTATQS